MHQKIQFYTSKLKSKPEIILSIIFVAVFAFLIVVPFAQMIYTTLTYQSYDLRLERGAEEGAFTFFHYKRMFNSDLTKSLFLKPFWNSIKVGVSVTLIAMFVGIYAGMAFCKDRHTLQEIFPDHNCCPLHDPVVGHRPGLAAFFSEYQDRGTCGSNNSPFRD